MTDAMLSADLVEPQLAAATREEAIRELVQLLALNGYCLAADHRVLEQTIVDGEQLGSVATGNGLSFLHAEVKAIAGCAVVLGRSTAGIDLQAIDDAPTYLVFLIVSHPEYRSEYLRVFNCLVGFLAEDDICARALAAKDAHELLEVLSVGPPAMKEDTR